MLNKSILLASTTRVSGGALSFAPGDVIGLALWLDAADASTLVKDGSNRISQWLDKSGEGKHAAMPNSIYQPLYVPSGIAGKGSLDFENSKYLELPDLSGVFGSNNRSFFAVFEHFSPTDQGYLLSLGYFSTGGAGKSWRVSVDDGHLQLEITGADAATAQFPGTNPAQMACILTGTTISDHTMWLNGVGQGLSGSSIVNTDFGEASISQQNRGGPGGFIEDKAIDGLISEILVYNSALSSSDRQKVEGYLAHKWSIAGQLPSEHPYKSVAP